MYNPTDCAHALDYASVDPGTRYAVDVVFGKIVVGRLVWLSCARHVVELYRSLVEPDFPFHYAPDWGADVVDFAKLLRHYKGPLAGQLFEPEPWQEFILYSIFGWLRKSDDCRRFRYAYIQIGRKNGKTFVAASIALFMLTMDAEGGPEIYSAASTRDQSKLCWLDTCKFVRSTPEMRTRIMLRTNKIICPSNEGIFIPLAADAKTLDGLNPHCVIYDELHAAKERLLWDVLEDAFGARDQPLMFSITTAGFDKFSLCYEQRKHCVSVLEAYERETGYVDDTYFSYIAEPDEPDDIYKPIAWQKGNPNLGVSKKLEYVAEQAAKAAQMPGKEPSFIVKQVDKWTDVAARWLNVTHWGANARLTPAMLPPKAYAVGGFDLSHNTDLTALALLYEPGTLVGDDVDELYGLRVVFFLPEETMELRVKRDKVPYDKWAKEGWIILTPGNVIDTAFIRKYIIDEAHGSITRAIGYDPWRTTAIMQDVAHAGIECIEVRQTFATLSGPSLALERLILNGGLIHDGNPVMAWCVANCAVKVDANENIRPDKENSNERIDGVVATVMALAVAIADANADPTLSIVG